VGRKLCIPLKSFEKREIYLHSHSGASGYLWHVFSYEKRKCEKEEQAEAETRGRILCLHLFIEAFIGSIKMMIENPTVKEVKGTSLCFIV
jgi:hypothetical protein